MKCSAMVDRREASSRLVHGHDLAPEPVHDCAHVVWSDQDNSSQSSSHIGEASGDISPNHGLDYTGSLRRVDAIPPTVTPGPYEGSSMGQCFGEGYSTEGLKPAVSAPAPTRWLDGLAATDVPVQIAVGGRVPLPAEHVAHGRTTAQPVVLRGGELFESSIGVGAGSLERRGPPKVKKQPKSTDQDHVLFSTSSSEHSVFSESDRGGHGTSTPNDVRPQGAADARRLQAAPDEMAATCVGSVLHASGGCRPCLFYASEVGCREQESCLFCHSPHKGKNRPHPSKKMRARYRKLILQQQERTEQEKGDDQELRELLQSGELLSI